MHTTALIGPPPAPGRAAPPSDPGDDASRCPSEHRTFREMLAELIPLIDAVPGEGPPVVLLVGPWLLLVLMLSGPFAFLVILVVFMVVAAAVLVALTAASLAVPYVIIRSLRRHRGRHAPRYGRAAQLVPVESPRVVS